MREGHDMRAKVIDFYKPDVVALVETWLRGEEEMVVEGYRWFGWNSRNLHRKAVRGSGGVRLLVREEVLEKWAGEVMDADVEDILWARLSQGMKTLCYWQRATSHLSPQAGDRGQRKPSSCYLNRWQSFLTRTSFNLWRFQCYMWGT